MLRICHRRPLGNCLAPATTGQVRKYVAALATSPLRKRVVIDFVNAFSARSGTRACDLLVFRLRNIHEVTRMLTESFTDRALLFATKAI